VSSRAQPTVTNNPVTLEDENGLQSAIRGNPIYTRVAGPVDAFGSLIVASPDALFLSSLLEDAATLVWFESTNGANSNTAYQTNESSVLLRVASGGAAASGDYAIKQSRAVPYYPAHGHRVLVTATFGAAVANLTRRVGLFDDEDGIFLEQTNSGVQWVVRTFTSGAAVDTATHTQANWNLDNLDGDDDAENPSGVTLDLSTRQILVIDLQWLAVGTIRVGFDLGGTLGIVWVHSIDHQNTGTLPYIRSATLPVRFEIRATGAVGTVQTLRQICASVISFGMPESPGFPRSAGNGATAVAVNARVPICSIRPQNKRVPLIPQGVQLYAATVATFWELVLNATLGGPTAFNAVDALAHADVDVASTTIANGQVVAAGYVAAAATAGGKPGAIASATIGRTLLGLSPGGTADILTLACTTIGGASQTAGMIDFTEVY